MMKCPECGFEIPDGQMYCGGCGWEVKLVPEFEPEIENRIDKTLSRLAGKIDDADKASAPSQEKKAPAGKSASAGRRQPKKKIPVVPVIAGVCLVLCLIVLGSIVHKTSADYQRLSVAEAERGNGEAAIAHLDRAIEKEPKNAQLLLLKARYQTELLGDPAEAVKTLEAVINSAAFPEEDAKEAYRMSAELFLMQKDHAALTALLANCPFPDVTDSIRMMLPARPVASPAEGVFQGSVSIALSAGQNEIIRYTLDGSEPDASSAQYTEPILLEGEGDYTVKAACVSADGVMGEVAAFSYTLEKKAVPEPNVLEDSGLYSEPTKIVVTAGKDLTIRYTTGEDEIPDITSTEYTGPIDMPEGDSVFRFIACDKDGRISEPVVRQYTLTAERKVTPDEAVLNVKHALIGAGYMLDLDGHVQDTEGYYAYAVDQTVTIGNDGTFYYIREIHVRADGSREDTGRLYAVQTESGMTKRLGYDSAGKIMLMHF